MKTCENHVKFLASIPLFSNWNTKRLFQFSSCFRKVTLRKNQFLYRQDVDIANKVFVASSGTFVLRRRASSSSASFISSSEKGSGGRRKSLEELLPRDDGHILVELNPPCVFGIEEYFFGAAVLFCALTHTLLCCRKHFVFKIMSDMFSVFSSCSICFQF